MNESITVTIKEIHCIKRSEFKGRSDEIYLKHRGSHEWLWPTHARAEKIRKGHSVYPNFDYYYRPVSGNVTLELWEHDKLAKDDFLGSITFDSNSQGDHTQYMDGDGGSYRVTYSVNNPYRESVEETATTDEAVSSFEEIEPTKRFGGAL